MAFNKDELKNLQNNKINQDHVDQIVKALSAASDKLIADIDTEEFENWLQKTFKELIEQGKAIYCGFGITDAKEAKDVENAEEAIDMYICTKYDYVFKHILITAKDIPDIEDISEAEGEIALTNWLKTGIEKILEALFDKLVMDLDLEVGNIIQETPDEKTAMILVKVSLD